MTYPFGETAVFHARTVTGQDALGNDVYGSAATTVPGCAFDPGGSTELVQGQDQVVTQPTVYPPPGTVAGPVDQVTIRGVTYDVDGSPNLWQNAYTGRQLTGVKLKAVTG